MSRSMVVLLFLLFGTGQEIIGQEIKFPTTVVSPVVEPQPKPDLSPQKVPRIDPGEFYVVESDKQFFLLASPEKFASVTYETGPLRLRGLFSGGTGKVETRNYTSSHIAIVDAKYGVSGRAELIAIPAGLTEEKEIIRTWVEIGTSPRPPPDDEKDEVSPDVPPPSPVDPSQLRVIMVFESGKAYDKETTNILFSTKIVEYLNAKCVKDAAGRPSWRKWPKGTTVVDSEPEPLRSLWNQYLPRMGTLPQIVISAGTTAEIYPLPATEQATLDLLKKIGGDL